MNWLRVGLLLGAMALSGCVKNTTLDAPGTEGEVGKPGTSLAYEHTISVQVADDALAERMKAVREACADERFGHCSLLKFEESSGRFPSGVVSVRVAPASVEPLVALASVEGSIGSRATHAEDLAVAVADATRERDQLTAQRTQLLAFQNRKDLAVADMIALAHEIAVVESTLADLTQTSANLQRRVETNLLTIDFRAMQTRSRWSSVGNSLSDSLDSFLDGTSDAIEMIAFGLPFLILLFPLALFWRWLWRRVTLRKTSTEPQLPGV